MSALDKAVAELEAKRAKDDENRRARQEAITEEIEVMLLGSGEAAATPAFAPG